MSVTPPGLPVSFEPIKTPRAFEVICDQIRERLTTGALKPGMKLPSERDLAQQFGVSRSAVREAMRTLENAGVVFLVKGSRGGAFICENDAVDLTSVIQNLLESGAFTLQELTEARLLVQELIVRLACQRATDDQIRALEKVVDRTEAATRLGRIDDRLDANIDFYKVLASMTGNKVCVLLIDSLSTILQQFLVQSAATSPLPGLVQSRRRFLKHLAARDPKSACLEMSRHLRRLNTHLLAKIGRRRSEEEMSSRRGAG